MKKRILALLLAGVLTASLASCVTSGERNEGTSTGGTEEFQTRGEDPKPVTPVTWIDVDETVYVTSSAMTLVSVENASTTVVAKQLDKLKRIKVGSNKKDIVLKDNVQYYADHAGLTTDDLMGESMVACADTVMYANSSANIRKYATSSYAFSSVIKTLQLNESVTVVARGDKWYRIRYTDGNFYYVFASLLSGEAVTDPNDLANYPDFPDLPEEERMTMYVSTHQLAFRKAPSTRADEVAGVQLNKEDSVIVLSTATVDGLQWSKVLVPMEAGEGTGGGYHVGFVASNCLSETKGGGSAMTLDEMLALYDTFEALEAPLTMYVKKGTDPAQPVINLNVRSTPAFPEKGANIVGSLSTKDNVTVVAIGDAAEVVWAMLDYGEGEYYFVSYSYLTTDPEGDEIPLTLEQLIALYPAFTKCEERVVYATKQVNCNTKPENQTDVAKKLEIGEAVTVVAEGSVNYWTWYIFQTADGNLYFAAHDVFTTVNPVG